MRLPKPILEKLIVIYSYQQRYEMFLNIQNNTKKIPTFLWGSGRNTYVCQSKNTIQGWALYFLRLIILLILLITCFATLTLSLTLFFLVISYCLTLAFFNISTGLN